MIELSDVLFENAKKIIADIIEDYEVKYPLDIFDLCSKLEFDVIPYSYFREHKELLLKQSNDGLSLYQEERKKYCIYYNDAIESEDRIKFTIAHELGHIFLQTSDERLANFFAGYLLAPVILIIEKGFDSEDKIMEYFKVGYQCASASLKRARRRKTCNEPITKYEKCIIDSQK